MDADRPPTACARWVGCRVNLDPEGVMAMAEKTQGTRTPTAVAPKAATAVDRTAELSGEVLQSVEEAQRAAIEAVRKFVETAESLPPAVAYELVDLLRHLAHMEYGALRSIVRSVVDVDVLSGG